MRVVHAAVLLAVSVSPALAQRGPYVVIPGRPDVPIFENARLWRLEITPPPNRPLPRPAQSYSRSWRMESAPTPADLPSNNPNTIAPVITPYVFPGAGPPGPGPVGPHR